jgi:hypothetical protein
MGVEFPFRIIPRVGFSFVRFGEPLSQHRQGLGEFESWQRDPARPRETDLYLDMLMSFDYDDQDRLDYIEVINDEGQILLDDLPILATPLGEVLSGLSARGFESIGPRAACMRYPRWDSGSEPDSTTSARSRSRSWRA